MVLVSLPFEIPITATDRYTVLPSPVGDLLLLGNGSQLTGLHFGDNPHARIGCTEDAMAFVDVRQQLSEYFANDRTHFDLRLAPSGTAFQLTVWAALTEIEEGETSGYGDIAIKIGSPGAARAVGAANHVNPIAIIVPCHRVIGADGSLTGFGGGLDVKRQLLDHEIPGLF